jgi:hypothetical protein
MVSDLFTQPLIFFTLPNFYILQFRGQLLQFCSVEISDLYIGVFKKVAPAIAQVGTWSSRGY